MQRLVVDSDGRERPCRPVAVAGLNCASPSGASRPEVGRARCHGALEPARAVVGSLRRSDSAADPAPAGRTRRVVGHERPVVDQRASRAASRWCCAFGAGRSSRSAIGSTGKRVSWPAAALARRVRTVRRAAAPGRTASVPSLVALGVGRGALERFERLAERRPIVARLGIRPARRGRAP